MIGGFRQAIRWGIKSIGGLITNLFLLTLWVDGFGAPPQFAIFVNWFLIALGGYAVADRWVFQDHESPSSIFGHMKQLFAMQGIMSISKAINYVLYVLLMGFGVPYQLAWAIGAVATFLLSFGGNREVWARGFGTQS